MTVEERRVENRRPNVDVGIEATQVLCSGYTFCSYHLGVSQEGTMKERVRETKRIKGWIRRCPIHYKLLKTLPNAIFVIHWLPRR